MSTTQELIDWLKSPCESYEGGLAHNTYEGHLLDREERDAVVARLEAAEKTAVALAPFANPPKTGYGARIIHECCYSEAKNAVETWWGLK